ncbi:MAG TPA: GspH/FimT family protein [Burkholderiaceae bacterium]|jgi:type IV fimbrial biogenesis protein FimT|nr:GspH/FimT family protein [Burkholderiaceae bacterium]
MRDRPGGFSLIELLAVLAVLAVLLGLGAPHFSAWLARLRTEETAQAFERTLVQARNESLARGQRVVVAPREGDWAGGWDVFLDANLNGTLDAGDTALTRHQSSGEVPVLADFGDGWGGRIVFLPGGFVRGADGAPVAGRMRFGPADLQRTVCLSLLGKPQLVKGATCPA